MLQHGKTSVDDAFLCSSGLELDPVVIYSSAQNLAVHVAIPFEMRIFGMEDHAAPAVENGNFKGGDVFGARQFENIVDTIVVGGGDAIGQIDVEGAHIIDSDFP